MWVPQWKSLSLSLSPSESSSSSSQVNPGQGEPWSFLCETHEDCTETVSVDECRLVHSWAQGSMRCSCINIFMKHVRDLFGWTMQRSEQVTNTEENDYHFIIKTFQLIQSVADKILFIMIEKKCKNRPHKHIIALKIQSTVLFVLSQTDSRWGLKHWGQQAQI